MKTTDLPDHDHRERESRAHEYWVASVGSGRVVCYHTGLMLVDFYRTSGVLAKDVPPKEPIKP
jgi:hypothetical protein